MAKKSTTKKSTAKKSTTKKSTAKKSTASRGSSGGSGRSGGRGRQSAPPSASGKQLVIVESPTKARTINRYLGDDYVVMASVGHVRDLPSRAPKGSKQPVPGVDLEHDFEPTYEVMPDKKTTVTQLKKAARQADGIFFATDMDREGEAIAWHLAQALGVEPGEARRVAYNAITKAEIENAFAHPRAIDSAKVNAQQARRILDRIVGYQVSPFLWKKVAGGLSAGRVQSVATRLVVEREREIEAFVPDEFWRIAVGLAVDLGETPGLAEAWRQWLAETPEGQVRSQKDKLAWHGQRRALRAELIELDGEEWKASDRHRARDVAAALGMRVEAMDVEEDPKAKGPAKQRVTLRGEVDPEVFDGEPRFRIRSVQTRPTTTRPPAPFITSTMQQAGFNRLGMSLQITMRIAQQLYEGVRVAGVGETGLITYMRTDSTHLSREAIGAARGYIEDKLGDAYLPEKPNVYTSSNKSAQEAHEAIRPTDVNLTPDRVRGDLSNDQHRLYTLIWQRFVACQMTPARWDSTTVLIDAEPLRDAGVGRTATLRATGRRLAFDGFYRIAGMPSGAAGEDAILPEIGEGQALGPFDIEPSQHFTNPPARYTEASLQKKLEEEGIGRPSTYASIIQTIQDRKYVERVAARDRRLRATDLGRVVTDMLVEAFPRIMELDYTRDMESELDKVEDENLNWVTMLHQFYGPFRENLEQAHETMTHAKAVTEPAPYECPQCGSPTVYRFGRNGRFLSCSTYPECKYAAPINREGEPMEPERSDVLCPVCNASTLKRVGRFGPFLGCSRYPECDGIVKLDPKQHTVVLPKAPPMTPDLPCPKCESPLYLRRSKRGPWLSCSTFPKCRGRLAWSKLEEPQQAELEKQLEAHEQANPQPVLRNTRGEIIPEGYAPEIAEADGGSGSGDDAQLDSDAA